MTVLVAAEGVSKAVALPAGGRLHVLDDVHVGFAAGQSAAIVGRSGSGKTTLLSLLGLLDRPDAGRIVLGGVSTRDLADAAAARLRNERIGFVFQSYSLVPYLSAAENVELALLYGEPVGRRERRRRVADALDELGLGDRQTSRPRDLSGGEQQRVAIARALVRNPSILLADEPTGALDLRTADVVLGLLLRSARERGCAVVVVTHDSDVASAMDRTVGLDAGRLPGSGHTVRS